MAVKRKHGSEKRCQRHLVAAGFQRNLFKFHDGFSSYSIVSDGVQKTYQQNNSNVMLCTHVVDVLELLHGNIAKYTKRYKHQLLQIPSATLVFDYNFTQFTNRKINNKNVSFCFLLIVFKQLKSLFNISPIAFRKDHKLQIN